MPDCIIHAAGRVGGIQANMARPADFLTDNMYMGLNLIDGARTVGIPRLINIGSSCMYPRNAKNPLREGQILTGTLEPTNEGYALAKISAARLCQYVRSENPDLAYHTLIPCNLFGRHDSFAAGKSHLIPAIIVKIHDALQQKSEEVEIWGDGTARREFMYAGDFAESVWTCVDKQQSLPGEMNIGIGVDHSINDYYHAVADVVGWDGKFVHDLTKPVGMKQKLVDVTKQKRHELDAANFTCRGHCAYLQILSSRKPRYPMTEFPLASASWDEKEISALHSIIDTGRFTMGHNVERFEREFADYLGASHCVMVNSGSSANLLMIAALRYTKQDNLKLQPGDEVIVPAGVLEHDLLTALSIWFEDQVCRYRPRHAKF